MQHASHAIGVAGTLVLVDVSDVRAWFQEYLVVFAACGRGESNDLRALTNFYGVPLLLTTDATAVALLTEDEVLEAMSGQIAGMRAAGYERTATLDSDTTAINATTAIHTAAFSRRRSDGSEIGRLQATYLITDRGHGRRISVLAVHGA